MISTAAALSAVLLLPSVFGQNASTTPSTAPGPNPFTIPVVSGTACGTSQQNFNQCVTKVGKDIANCSPTDNVCLCQTYANIAACYNGCPDLNDGATYKGQSQQYCAQANISTNTTSVNNQTTPTTSTTSTTPVTPATATNTTTTGTSSTRTNSTTAPATSASAFARNAANRNLDLSTSLIGLAAGLCGLLFA